MWRVWAAKYKSPRGERKRRRQYRTASGSGTQQKIARSERDAGATLRRSRAAHPSRIPTINARTRWGLSANRCGSASTCESAPAIAVTNTACRRSQESISGTSSTRKSASRRIAARSGAVASIAVGCSRTSTYRSTAPARAPAAPGKPRTTRARPNESKSDADPFAWLTKKTKRAIPLAAASSGRTASSCSRRTVISAMSATRLRSKRSMTGIFMTSLRSVNASRIAAPRSRSSVARDPRATNVTSCPRRARRTP